MPTDIIMYNHIGEYAGLLLSGLLLSAMLYTRPRKSYVYRFIFVGNIVGILAIIMQISICIVANHPDSFYNRYVFTAQLIIFLLLYNGVLYCIFSYVNMMSLVRRKQRREFIMMYCVLSLAYIVGIIILIASGSLYTLEVDGINLIRFTRFYSCAGIVCAVICYYASLYNKSSISRIIWHTVCIIVPIELVTLIAQIICIQQYYTIFIGLTYVPVFMFAFLLFHNVPYDEVSGCKSRNALDEFIIRNLDKTTFYIQFLSYKMPTSEYYIAEDQEIHFIGVNACRSIERISKKIDMYMIDANNYVNIINTSDETEAQRISDQIRGVMDGVKAELKVPFNYVLITGKSDASLESPMKIRQLFEHVTNRFVDQYNSYSYFLNPGDLEEFAELYQITATLKNIRNLGNLDDERVLVYAQPIYSVEEGSFKAAEALMRIKVGDRMIFPDKFIPVAEKSGCVHTLTRIILNKVCKAVESMEENYDFDAISVNVSSKELSHPHMYQDLLDIIESYDIDVKKIRMEITETAMFENFELANRNMEILTKEGIQLYLDDFGTGYSSLERVMDCPVKTIKFDKSLLYKSQDDNRMDDILTYMIEVLKKNGFVTLVEGVEDESQSQYSVNRGFDYIQGYHYAKPAPIEDLTKFFNKRNRF